MKSGTLLHALLILALFTQISCRVTSRAVSQVQQTDQCERLEIIYRAHAAAGPLFAPQQDPGVLLTAASDGQFPNLTWSKAELRIEFPHPDGRTDMARASLYFTPVDCGQGVTAARWSDRIEERQVRRSTRKERWFHAEPHHVFGNEYASLDLSKAEIDPILDELRDHGFFTEASRTPDAASQLEVRINRRWTAREWAYEPTLDALTTRLFEEGRRPAGLPHPAP